MKKNFNFVYVFVVFIDKITSEYGCSSDKILRKT